MWLLPQYLVNVISIICCIQFIDIKQNLPDLKPNSVKHITEERILLIRHQYYHFSHLTQKRVGISETKKRICFSAEKVMSKIWSLESVYVFRGTKRFTYLLEITQGRNQVYTSDIF